MQSLQKRGARARSSHPSLGEEEGATSSLRESRGSLSKREGQGQALPISLSWRGGGHETEGQGQGLPIFSWRGGGRPILSTRRRYDASLIQSGKARGGSLHCLSACCMVGRVLSLQRGRRAFPIVQTSLPKLLLCKEKACPLSSLNRGQEAISPRERETRASPSHLSRGEEEGPPPRFKPHSEWEGSVGKLALPFLVLRGGPCLVLAERKASLPLVK